jgi:hypothetical protein
MSLYSLGDQLHIPRLEECALKHVLSIMDTTINDTDSTLWNECLTSELQQKIVSIQQILSSEGQQQQRSLYFNTFTEYLGLLGEQVQYYKERLEEAMESQKRQRLEEESPQRYSYMYTQIKIEQQSLKLQMLQSFYKQQKQLFGTGVPGN